jgi:hypothetical protein
MAEPNFVLGGAGAAQAPLWPPERIEHLMRLARAMNANEAAHMDFEAALRDPLHPYNAISFHELVARTLREGLQRVVAPVDVYRAQNTPVVPPASLLRNAAGHLDTALLWLDVSLMILVPGILGPAPWAGARRELAIQTLTEYLDEAVALAGGAAQNEADSFILDLHQMLVHLSHDSHDTLQGVLPAGFLAAVAAAQDRAAAQVPGAMHANINPPMEPFAQVPGAMQANINPPMEPIEPVVRPQTGMLCELTPHR